VNKPENDDPLLLGRAAERVDWQAPVDGPDRRGKQTHQERERG
jgi:hypothetical protein